MAQYILAHDLGTSGNKATLYSEEGALVASRTVAYPTHYFNGNWAEQDPAHWWQAVCESTQALVQQVNPAEIAGVALSGQMMGCTLVDQTGAVLRPSMIYCDQRSAPQAARILEQIDLKSFYGIVGHRVSPAYALEKLMWVRDHEPQNYARAHRMLCAKDYINFRLTGRMATDYSDASGTNAFDLNTFQWSEKIIRLAGVEGALFPEPMDSTRILGEITRAAAAATGLKAGTPVAVGGGDGSCAGVGVGCIKPGSTYNYLGSSSWVALTVKKPIVDEQMRTMNWAHCVPGYLHPSGSVQTAGSSLHWLKEVVCTSECAEAAARNTSVYQLMDAAIARSPAGANGVLFLPYMLGERTPWWNPNARGAFIGMNLGTRREDLLRAVMEGITLNLGMIVNIFRQHLPIEAITVIGGGARSAVWRQMMADIYDCRVESLNFLEEATSMGAAVIGGVGVGLFKDFDVIHRFIKVDQSAQPDPASRDRYRQIAPVFEQSYRALVDVFDNLAKIN